MKKTIKTKNGTAVADFPDDFKHDNKAIQEAAEYLDEAATECNAGTTRVEYRDKEGKIIGSLTWTDNTEKQ